MMRLLLLLIVIVFIVLIAAQLGAFTGTAPTDLGAKQGQLKAPSPRPNSVSSQADKAASAYIEPLIVASSADWQRLQQLVISSPRLKVITQQSHYLYAQARSRLMGFVDDLEIYWDEAAGVAHVRSASRLGNSDLGANRARVEALRARYQTPSTQ